MQKSNNCELRVFESLQTFDSQTYSITIVSRKYAPPPLATLALVQNAGGGGGLHVGCDNLSHDYTLPSGHEVIVGGGWGPSVGPC